MNNFKMLALSAVASIVAVPAFAAPYTLTTGTGDGQVTVGVDGYGSFGSNIGANATNATYNPVGAGTAAGTVFESGVAFRLGTTGARTFLSTGLGASLANPAVTGTPTSGSSSFTNSGIAFSLSQTVTNLFNGGVQNGSQLAQTYSFTNNTGRAVTVELTRYLDGDLLFNGNLVDGGGRFVNAQGQEILFETDTAIGSNQADTFLGIYNTGGTSTGYQLQTFNTLRTRLLAGEALANTVQGDGADADQFIDAGGGYDVTLGLGRSFALGVGASGIFTTYTVFGTGTPGSVVIPGVPEPTTWTAMLAGFALVGAGLRRRRPVAALS